MKKLNHKKNLPSECTPCPSSQHSARNDVAQCALAGLLALLWQQHIALLCQNESEGVRDPYTKRKKVFSNTCQCWGVRLSHRTRTLLAQL